MGTTVHDCQFYGIKWDKEATEAVALVAKALLNLTELFNAQQINIECMLKVVGKETVDDH